MLKDSLELTQLRWGFTQQEPHFPIPCLGLASSVLDPCRSLSPPFGHQHKAVMLQARIGASRKGRWEMHGPICCGKGKEHTRYADSLGFDLLFPWGPVQHHEKSTFLDQRNLLLVHGKSFLKAREKVSYRSLIYVSHQKYKYQESTFDACWMEAEDQSLLLRRKKKERKNPQKRSLGSSNRDADVVTPVMTHGCVLPTDASEAAWPPEQGSVTVRKEGSPQQLGAKSQQMEILHWKHKLITHHAT